MDAISYSNARANLAKTMDRVCDDHETVIVTRQGGGSVVIMSLEDYNATEETIHLLRSNKNAMRLMESIERLDSGQGRERNLIE